MQSLALSLTHSLPLPGVLTRAQAGDREAFEELLRAHERLVLRTAWRMLGSLDDAKDIAQNALLRLHKHLPRFQSVEQIGPWLYAVTLNLCRDELRRRTRFVEPPPNLTDPAQSLESLTVLEQQRAWLREALLELPEKQRAALILRELEGVSTSDAARILNSTETTIRTHISLAKQRLRQLWEKHQ